jgi:transposase
MIRHPLAIPLDPQQRQQVWALMRGVKTEYRLKPRATLIWPVAEAHCSPKTVAQALGVCVKTVRKWCERFRTRGVPGLDDAPRSGAPYHFDAAQRCEVLAIACDAPQHYGWEGQTLWTYDNLTEAVNRTVDGFAMSRSSVVRTLKAEGLKPHQTPMWLHSPDPHFKEKVNDIVDLYLTDWDDDVVVCSIDEKTGMQANERQYETPMPQVRKAGRIEYEYIRHGTLSLLASFNIITGAVYAECRARRTADDLLDFMEHLAAQNQDARRIIVIWDNLNTHKEGPDHRWTAFNARHGNTFEFHYTPWHASWVNQVEIFFSIIYKRALKHGSFTSTEDLKARVMAFIARWNTGEGHPFHWTFRGYPMQGEAA